MWTDVVSKQPRNDRGWNNLGGGRLYFFGELDLVERAFRKAISLNPSCVDAYSNLAVLLGGQEKFEECLNLLNRAQEITPEFVNAYFNYGLYAKRAELYDKGIEGFRETIRLVPQHRIAHYQLASI
ncbi:MAG: hypothetical protein AAGA64_11675 [Bacteroidota bacterium]